MRGINDVTKLKLEYFVQNWYNFTPRTKRNKGIL